MNSLIKFDKTFYSRKIKYIAGIDEAGRGPIAGPVVAAAVIFDKKKFHSKINDSKKLSEIQRNELYDWIINNCISYGIGIVEQNEIDNINILQATLKSMKQAVSKLSPQPNLCLIDGNKSFLSELKTKTIVKGDSKSFSIAAASIIAKVTRDRIMKNFSIQFIEYSWENNKGYATKSHINAVKKFGASPIHRKTFLTRIINVTDQEKLF
jgi:ribonuclease HII